MSEFKPTESKKRKWSKQIKKKNSKKRAFKRRKLLHKSDVQDQDQDMKENEQELGKFFLDALAKNQEFPPWESELFLQREAIGLYGSVYSERNESRLKFSMQARGQKIPVFGTFSAWKRVFKDLDLDESKIHVKKRIDGQEKMLVAIYSMTTRNVCFDTIRDGKEVKEWKTFGNFGSGKWHSLLNIACTTLVDAGNESQLDKVMEFVKGQYIKKSKSKKTFGFEKATGWKLDLCDEKTKKFKESDFLDLYESFKSKVPKPKLIFQDEIQGKWHTVQDSPCYKIIKDEIVMPACHMFDTPEAFGAVLFHEMSHATGHASRLGRFDKDGKSTVFQDKDLAYAHEELVAEICTSFLCKQIGILTPRRLSLCGAYVSTWAKTGQISSDQVLEAISMAVKAFHFVTNKY